MNQDKETGISFMKIVEKLDAGPYMRQLKVKLEKQTTSKMLNEKIVRTRCQKYYRVY